MSDPSPTTTQQKSPARPSPPKNTTKRKKCPNGSYRKRGTDDCIPREAPTGVKQQIVLGVPDRIASVADGRNDPMTEESEGSNVPNLNFGMKIGDEDREAPRPKSIDDRALSLSKDEPSQPKIRKIARKIVVNTAAPSPPSDTMNDINDEYPFLYPSTTDPSFNLKIALRKEFSELAYDATIYPIKQRANQMCSSAFEIMPHQLFVKKFLSLQTPYNGLLLFMGLGSGKTCSAIGITEEMRTYLQQTGLDQKDFVPRILVMAAPNVQKNFRHQLFDPDKLHEDNGVWNMKSCMGNKFIQEINPSHVKGMTRESLINSVHRLINKYYDFTGYQEFVNYAKHRIYGEHDEYRGKLEIENNNIQKYFNNRLIVIDEVHNIRTEDTKQCYVLLLKIVQHAENVRLLLLSATPMYNSPKEVIGLLNLLLVNDRRTPIRDTDVFDSKESVTVEGEKILRRKLTGYVSYVRGENPYTFPFRIYPSTFAPQRDVSFPIPTVTYQNKPMEEKERLQHIEVYKTQMTKDSYQHRLYNKMCLTLQRMPSDQTQVQTHVGYTRLLGPLQALNMVYPNIKYEGNDNMDALENEAFYECIGSQGLKQTMDSNDQSRSANPERYDFKYKTEIMKKYGRVFSQPEIGKYSHKIAAICHAVRNSTGIVMVYSQFIDGGLIPLALALEEMGFVRYGETKSLFAKDKVVGVGVPPSGNQYVMITGDACFSKDNVGELSVINEEANKSGEKIKCVLISMAGAEGLDYKNIRQVHIMEPWYNMSRLEQIIGRGVRNLSHCRLPFEERNVEIYLHTSLHTMNPEQECVDNYFYRLAEKKAIKIGKVTRILKQTAIDCLIHSKQHAFTTTNLWTLPENKNIQIRLASNNTQLVPFQVGDRAFSNTCDYMETCDLTCLPHATVEELSHQNTYTYHQTFVETQRSHIAERIRQLFKEKHFYPRNMLIQAINVLKVYPIEHIYSTLTYLVNNRQEMLVDHYGRTGMLVNQGDIYMFQPSELDNVRISILDRSIPIDMQNKALILPNHTAPDPQTIPITKKTGEELVMDLQSHLHMSFSKQPPDTTRKEEWNYYEYACTMMPFLLHVHQYSEDEVKQHLIIHALETMKLSDCVTLLTYVGNKTKEDNDGIIVDGIRTYFEKSMVHMHNKQYVPLCRGGTMVWYQNGTPSWTEFPSAMIPPSLIKQRSIANLSMIGFIHNEEFKTKDLTNPKSKSAIARQKGKISLLKMVNTVVQDTKIKYTPNDKKVDLLGAAFLLEMVMRHDGETYFFTPEEIDILRIKL